MATEEKTDWYRFTGMRNAWDETSVLILEGSSTNPKVAVEKGKEVQLTEAQVQSVKDMGGKLSSVSEDKVSKLEEETPPKGSEQQATAQSGSTPPATGKKS